LGNVSDGFRCTRSFEFFFDGRVIGFVELSDLVSGSDDKGEGTFEKKDNGCHLHEDIGSWTVKDSGFVKDFVISLRPLRFRVSKISLQAMSLGRPFG